MTAAYSSAVTEGCQACRRFLPLHRACVGGSAIVSTAGNSPNHSSGKPAGFADAQGAIEGRGRLVADEAGGVKSLRFHQVFHPPQAVHHLVVAAGLDDLAGTSEPLPGAGRRIVKHDLWAVFLLIGLILPSTGTSPTGLTIGIRELNSPSGKKRRGRERDFGSSEGDMNGHHALTLPAQFADNSCIVPQFRTRNHHHAASIME